MLGLHYGTFPNESSLNVWYDIHPYIWKLLKLFGVLWKTLKFYLNENCEKSSLICCLEDGMEEEWIYKNTT
jgi:hypothetical protein